MNKTLKTLKLSLHLNMNVIIALMYVANSILPPSLKVKVTISPHTGSVLCLISRDICMLVVFLLTFFLLGNFFILFCRLPIILKINSSEKFFQIYHQNVK